MSTELVEPPVATKNSETTLRADAETASVIRAAAALKGMSIAEYLRVEVLPIARKTISDAAERFPRPETKQPSKPKR